MVDYCNFAGLVVVRQRDLFGSQEKTLLSDPHSGLVPFSGSRVQSVEDLTTFLGAGSTYRAQCALLR